MGIRYRELVKDKVIPMNEVGSIDSHSYFSIYWRL
jgi:hypothetical protein